MEAFLNDTIFLAAFVRRNFQPYAGQVVTVSVSRCDTGAEVLALTNVPESVTHAKYIFEWTTPPGALVEMVALWFVNGLLQKTEDIKIVIRPPIGAPIEVEVIASDGDNSVVQAQEADNQAIIETDSEVEVLVKPSVENEVIIGAAQDSEVEIFIECEDLP